MTARPTIPLRWAASWGKSCQPGERRDSERQKYGNLECFERVDCVFSTLTTYGRRRSWSARFPHSPETVLVYTGLRIFDDNGIRSEQCAVDPAAARKMLRYHNPITAIDPCETEDGSSDRRFPQGLDACEDWGFGSGCDRWDSSNRCLNL